MNTKQALLGFLSDILPHLFLEDGTLISIVPILKIN